MDARPGGLYESVIPIRLSSLTLGVEGETLTCPWGQNQVRQDEESVQTLKRLFVIEGFFFTFSNLAKSARAAFPVMITELGIV